MGSLFVGRVFRPGTPFLLLLAAVAATACKAEVKGDDRPTRTERRIDEQLTSTTTVTAKEGIAAAIVIDVSGSMKEDV